MSVKLFLRVNLWKTIMIIKQASNLNQGGKIKGDAQEGKKGYRELAKKSGKRAN